MTTRKVAARLIASLGVVTAAAAVTLLPARAQKQNPLTLSCNGTIKFFANDPDVEPSPIRDLGLIVNFSEHTVSFQGHTIPITKADAAKVSFEGQETAHGIPMRSLGTIDRVTGAATVSLFMTDPEGQITYKLHCGTGRAPFLSEKVQGLYHRASLF